MTVQVGERRYRHLWLKYVTGIDLSRHCAVALHGRYSRLVDERSQEATVHLDEFPHALAWYLCGVTTAPYRWEDNPHLAVTAAPGHAETLAVQGLTVHLDGVKPIHFTATDNVPDDDPNASDPAYRTCRNWQFAHYLRARGVPDVHGDRPRITTLRPGVGQVELLPRPPRVKPADDRGAGTRTNRWTRAASAEPQPLAADRQLPLAVADDPQPAPSDTRSLGR
ncbi:hypothetical protein [Kitasatospora sp. NPDC092286]|uniref:hypothetical protein n=1 Tax=Kitasatospora sp. NPDC092286 TaxID=3364087 RepID=UPI003827A724